MPGPRLTRLACRLLLIAPLFLCGCYEIDLAIGPRGAGTVTIAMDGPRGTAFDETSAAQFFRAPGIDVVFVRHLDVVNRSKVWVKLSFRDVADLEHVPAFEGLTLRLTQGPDVMDLEGSYRDPNPEALRRPEMAGRPVRIGVKMPGLIRAANGMFVPTAPTVLWETSTDAIASGPIEFSVESGREHVPPGPHGALLAAIGAGIALVTMALCRSARDRHAMPLFLVIGGLLTLGFEVLLTRLFSAVFWYHFAFMAISIALLGQGAGASVVTALGRSHSGRRDDGGRRMAGRLLLLTSLAILLALAYLVRDTKLAAATTLGFVLLFLLASLPFFFFGAGLARVFQETTTGAGALYCANLLGAAAGTLAAIPLLSRLGAENALVVMAIVAAAAALSLDRGFGKVFPFALTLALVAILGVNDENGPLRLRTGKGGDAKVVDLGLWNSFSYVTVSREFGSSWGLSRSYRGPHAPSIGLEIDLNAFTPIVYWDHDPAHVMEATSDVTALVHHVKQDDDVLVIGPGGGKDVLAARVLGARHVTAVEINPLLVKLVGERFAHFDGGLYSDPKVEVVVQNGRTYVDTPGPPFDVIQASLVDTWAASANGAFTLSENHLYTIEAFEAYLGRLRPGGILSVTRWNHEPPRESLRLLSLVEAALRARGDPAPLGHVAVAFGGSVATFLVGRDPLDAATRAAIAQAAQTLGFEVCFGGDPAPQGAGHFRRALSQGTAVVASLVPWDISPPVDDRPFFFHTVRRRDYLRLPWQEISGDLNQIEAINAAAVWVVMRLLWVSMLAAFALILGPLLLARRRLGKLPFGLPLLYFSALGLAFVLVVSGSIGRLSVRIGNPTVAFVTLTFATLCGSSLGAMLSGRLIGRSRARLFLVPLGILCVSTLAGQSSLRDPWGIGILMALQGVMLGIPFPRGIETIRGTAIVPWAFAANGAFSVVGGSLALVIALLFGFRAILLCGVALYVVAAAAYQALAVRH